MRQMAYRKIIRINPYSRSSIIDAIKELEAEKDEIEKKRKKFVKAVAKAMAKRIEERYGSVRSSNITYDEENGSTGIFVWGDATYGKGKVQAHGQGLFFVEFGTGTLAGGQDGYRYGFYPGSWSEEHANTFQQWVLSDGALFSRSDGSYKYDNEAADAFARAIGSLDEIIKEAADEVFG